MLDNPHGHGLPRRSDRGYPVPNRGHSRTIAPARGSRSRCCVINNKGRGLAACGLAGYSLFSRPAMWLNRYMEDVNAKLEIISNTLTDMGKQFKQIDQRFEQIDRRFEQIDKRFEVVDQRFTELRTELKRDIGDVERNLRNEIKALEHNNNVRFDELAAGQAKFQAQLTRLKRGLFYEEGSREVQAEAIFDTSSQQYRQLDERLRVVERQLKIKAA